MPQFTGNQIKKGLPLTLAIINLDQPALDSVNADCKYKLKPGIKPVN